MLDIKLFNAIELVSEMDIKLFNAIVKWVTLKFSEFV